MESQVQAGKGDKISANHRVVHASSLGGGLLRFSLAFTCSICRCGSLAALLWGEGSCLGTCCGGLVLAGEARGSELAEGDGCGIGLAHGINRSVPAAGGKG